MNNVLSRTAIGTLALVAAVALSVSFANAQGVTFTQQMSMGASGAQVTALQSFLATKTTHYPEGLITGYFGALTQAAVQRFQCAENIVCAGAPATTGYGRVGPMTLARLNLRAGGVVSGGADVSAPVVTGITVGVSTSSATVHFGTNELTRGKVYYGATVTLFESFPLPVVTGTSAMVDSNVRAVHDITITGLSSATTYTYVVEATDASGNLSFTWPATFRTQ